MQVGASWRKFFPELAGSPVPGAASAVRGAVSGYRLMCEGLQCLKVRVTNNINNVIINIINNDQKRVRLLKD